MITQTRSRIAVNFSRRAAFWLMVVHSSPRGDSMAAYLAYP
jgi:hypothetical protein